MSLIEKIVKSFSPGLPLGNLTSQLFVNVYMNEFDQFAKHTLKARYYIRYADDFVFLSESRSELENILPTAAVFLKEKLRLELHPDKVFIKTLASGVDFLGWVHFPDHRVLRATTKRRMLKRLKKSSLTSSVPIGTEDVSDSVLQSYLGMLGHGNTFKLKRTIEGF